MAAPVGWRRVGSAQSGLAEEHDLELVFSAHGGVDRIPRLASSRACGHQRPASNSLYLAAIAPSTSSDQD